MCLNVSLVTRDAFRVNSTDNSSRSLCISPSLALELFSVLRYIASPLYRPPPPCAEYLHLNNAYISVQYR